MFPWHYATTGTSVKLSTPLVIAMQRGLRHAGAAIASQPSGAGRGAKVRYDADAAWEEGREEEWGAAVDSSSWTNDTDADSLDALVHPRSGGGGGSTGGGGCRLVAMASAAESDAPPSVAGFLYCTFFDDEALWTAEYDGPVDCEVPVHGHVCEGGYLQGIGPARQYGVDCFVIRGDPNSVALKDEIVLDGLVRRSDGASMGRCVFEKQRAPGRDGYKGLATWRLASCAPRANTGSGTPHNSAAGGGARRGAAGGEAVASDGTLVRPKKRRFTPERKPMTDSDWGDMDVWLALRCVSPVRDELGLDLRSRVFAAVTTTDYVDKTQLVELTRSLCGFAGPATFTQSMLDSWGDMYPNPVKARQPKFFARIHCAHWLALFRKLMDFKIGECGVGLPAQQRGHG